MADHPDAGAVRGAISAADFHVSLAQSAIVAMVAAGADRFSDEQRAAARELERLRVDANTLIGTSRALTVDELLARADELDDRAQRVVERADELGTVFPDTDGAAAAAPAALDVALDTLVDAVLGVADELTVDEDIEPDDLLWAAQRLAVALEEVEGLFVELGDRVARWRAEEVKEFFPVGVPATDRAYRAHLAAAPDRLYAAARAVALAARRGHLVELEAFGRPPQTRVRVADAWLDVAFVDNGRNYRVRVAGTPTDPTTPGVPDGELVHAIGAAAQLDLAVTEQRVLARDGAERARRALRAIAAYRDSGHRGDPQHAERLAALADASTGIPQIPYSHRPDSSQDLVDVLQDLHAERWPVASVLRDCLAAVARGLDDDGRDESGVDRLLSHPNEDAAAAEHVRALVDDYVATALEHQAAQLRDPRVLRYQLLSTVSRLHAQGRPATIATLQAVGTHRLVSRDTTARAVIDLESDGLLEREDPLARTPVFVLTTAGRKHLSLGEEALDA